MKTTTGILAAIAIGVGCSHAKPKTETPATALAPPPRAAPPARQESSEDTSPSPARAEAGADSIYFDFDSARIKQESRSILQEVGKELARNQKKVRIEGNCDERGTTEYNIALGDKRAREAKSYLERLGVSGRRISVVSYGSERPQDTGHDDVAWSKNRRDDFKIQ
jgi:peptidoglycan-associated lipoprotein